MPLAMKSVKLKKRKPKICKCEAMERFIVLHGRYNSIAVLGHNKIDQADRTRLGLTLYGVLIKYCPFCGVKI